MSYGGRRGQNVSQYLRELNTVPNHDSAQEDFAIDDELALFTNTQFFDFDSGQNTDFQPQPVKPDSVETQASPEDVTSTAGDFAGLDFMSGDFSFGDFGASYTSPTIQAFPDSIGGLQPIQPNPQGVYHQQSSYGHPSSQAGDKGKPETPTTMAPPGRPMSFEEASRLAAEEDKRRRNTAASARFRIKKKQREQALEKSAKEMTEKVTALEGRIQQLETENKWLKNLIMEKNDGSQDVASLWKDFAARRESEKGPEPINRSSSKDTESSPTPKTDSEPTRKEK